MSSFMYRQKRLLHIALIIIALMLSMMCHFSLRIAFPDIKAGDVWLAVVALLMTLAFTVLHTLRIATQYVASFYDLTTSEAWQLVKRSLIGLRRYPPVGPSLRVADGQADPEGSVVLHEIGGPGYLSVDHNNVAVTQRLGKLNRIWEPGFDMLEPYERVWDVVDIRPQHRTLRVGFMTRDGIPAHCDAEMTFKVGERWFRAKLKLVRRRGVNGFRERQRLQKDKNDRDTSYPFSKEVIFNLVRSKFVTSSTDPQAVTDWIIGITQGALDGAIRDELEKYQLDQFLDPIDSAVSASRMPSTSGPRMLGVFDGDEESVGSPLRSNALGLEHETREKKALHDLKFTILDEVVETGRDRGIEIEDLELTEIQPDNSAIPQQWLDTWRARVQKELDRYRTLNRLERIQATERIRVDVRAGLITKVIDRFEAISDGGALAELSAGLIITEFLAVLESMCGQGPEMQRLAFQQSESLIRVINAIQQSDSPFGQPGVSPAPPPTDEELDLWYP